MSGQKNVCVCVDANVKNKWFQIAKNCLCFLYYALIENPYLDTAVQ